MMSRSKRSVTKTYRTSSGRVLTDADIDVLAAEAEAGYDICVVCQHQIRLMGERNTSLYWQCSHGCTCLMLGCIPVDEKYGTAP